MGSCDPFCVALGQECPRYGESQTTGECRGTHKRSRSLPSGFKVIHKFQPVKLDGCNLSSTASGNNQTQRAKAEHGQRRWFRYCHRRQ